jgi:serine phosphatase RsbU (regulator of sigma subunit)
MTLTEDVRRFLFFAEYDDDTRKLRYSNCGHPPALLLQAAIGEPRLSLSGFL